MGLTVNQQLQIFSRQPQIREATIAYLTKNLSALVKKGERVILCFPRHEADNLSGLMEAAVERCGGSCVIWGQEDRRWKSLLQQAFYSRATTIIGPPLVILGLAKLRRYHGTPLSIRHAVTAGYPCLDWMIDGIVRGFDCDAAGSFGVGMSGVVAGFSCGYSSGIHLWNDVYGLDITDHSGISVNPGGTGEMVIYPQCDPQLRLPLGETGRLVTEPCRCGCGAPRLVEMRAGSREDPELSALGERLQSWTSVLDCRLKKGHYGLELEMIVFPGEKLPKLPAAAKQIIRPWDPKHDEPFFYEPI